MAWTVTVEKEGLSDECQSIILRPVKKVGRRFNTGRVTGRQPRSLR
jgi:hypothetical protein